MYEKEEQMLRGYLGEARSKAATVPEEQLEVMVREGIRKGTRLKRSRKRLAGGAILAAAAATAVLVIMLWSAPVQPKEQLASGPFPVLEGYDFGGDITLKSANEHGLIQPIGKTASEGDYSVTVDGVVVGSHQLKVLYTVENRSGDKAIVKGTRLEIKEPLGYGASFTGSGEIERGFHQQKTDFTFTEDDIPERLSVIFHITPISNQAKEEEVELQVDLVLELETYKEYADTIPLSQTITADGQQIILQEAVLSPTGIVLKAKIDKNNSLLVSGLSEIQLESVKDGESSFIQSHGSYGAGEEGSVVYFFDSMVLNPPDTLKMTAKGIQAVDPSKLEVVVDTEREIVLQSPDNKMKFGQYSEEENGSKLTIEYEGEEKDGKVYGLSFKQEFIDGEGKQHEVDSAQGSTWDSSSSRMTGYIYLKPGEYPQPLTFTLSSYSDVIEHPVEVPIIENGEPVDPLRYTVLAELPVPEGARQTEILTGSSNSNIRIGVRYEKENIGGELGLYPPQEYFQMLQEAGWTEDEDKRMGHVHFFSKDKAQITIRVGEDELRVYEMLEESP